MLRSDVVSDELWAVLESGLPADAGRPGRPWNNHRKTLEGVAWRFRTGSPWRDLPPEFGAVLVISDYWRCDGLRNSSSMPMTARCTYGCEVS